MRTPASVYTLNLSADAGLPAGLRTGSRGAARLVVAVLLVLAAGAGLLAQTNVTTQHNDISRSGANTTETILTPSNVNAATFGKLFALPVDGRVYAQPLYLTGLTMGAGTPQAGTVHNVVFVATEHDSVYAFDADTNGGANASPLWHVTLLDAAHGTTGTATSVPNGDVGTADIVPEIGITGTGVIDTTTKTLYLVGKVKQTTGTAGTLACSTGSPCYVQSLHALDVTTGAEKFGGPMRLSGSVPGNGNGSSSGTLNWDPLWEHNRPGLLLLNGIVYLGFAAHGDNGPWHGWILAYNASTLAQTGVWCTSPNGIGAGIWMSGSGLAADVPPGLPFGRMFVATGNGDYTTGAPPYTNTTDYGDSIVRLDLTNGVPTVSDEFTPQNQSTLDGGDTDVASGGVLLPADQTGANTHTLVQVGKEGKVYVVSRDSLSGYNTPVDKVIEEVSGKTGGLWSMPAYWNGNIFFWGVGSSLEAFSYSGASLSATWTSVAPVSASFPGSTPAISSNGTTNGVVWAVRSDAYNAEGPAILYAFNATNVATKLYDSSLQPLDTAGAATKFVVPTITNGKVYIGTATEVDIYGLSANSPRAATPVLTPGSGQLSGPTAVTITDTTSGAAIYYTLDGSTPTVNSTPYNSSTGVPVSGSVTINAIAIAGSSYLQSYVASQTYTLQTQTAAPTFFPVPGSYASTESVTISSSTQNATIYYTTDGSTPTASLTPHASPVTVTISATTTLNAIATSSALSTSLDSSGLYTIVAGGTGIDYSNGFSSAAATMTFNGSTDLDDTRLQLTNGGTNEAGSAFVDTPVNIQAFTTDFAFQLSNADADGITFTIQGSGPTALGPSGGGLGYGPDALGGTGGIPTSMAVKFDLYSNNGEGDDSTGLYTNGASPTTPAIDLTSSGIDLHSGDTMSVHMTYDGTTLSMTITDPVANKTFSTSWPVNIPSLVGGNTAYIGFTGGTGGLTSSQKVETWTFVSSGTASAPAAAAPTFTPPAGTYLGPQSVVLNSTTLNSSIFYSTDGSAPTMNSTPYSGAIPVTASETIKAIAVASGYSTSPVGLAAYVIETQVPPPTFTPAGGTYLNPQTVSINATDNAAIFYTIGGGTPTTSSTSYSGPITVASNETIQAIAVASGYFNSNAASASYTIGGTSATSLNLGSGFTAGAMILNGNATLNGTRLRLTDANANEASAAWYHTPLNIQYFTSNFTFQTTGGSNPQADGFAFVIQGGSTAAIGPQGGGLGYGPDMATNPDASTNTPIAQSIAVKFDLYSNSGEGIDSTGLYVNGASPTTPFVDLTSSGINLHSTDIFSVLMTYDGTNLTMTITDTTTPATFTQVWPINIPATVGGNSAFVGFTGGTGGDTAIQEIIGWTMNSSLGVTATPTFTPVAGTYSTAQPVGINDANNGAAIYYTTNGTTPNTNSTKYSGAAITVSGSETINAIALAPGYTQSAVGTAAYVIIPPASAPVITPATGTYSSTQTVTMLDSTTGAAIHYTTDGSQPTASSTTYSSSFTVSTTTTINAIATAANYTTSPTSSSVITIQTPTGLNYGTGFTSAGLALNGNASINGTRLRLTDTGANETASAWYTTPVNIQAFTSDFTFQLTDPTGNGITFTVQNTGTTALGPSGGGLGYGPDNVAGASSSPKTPIAKSVAIKFDLHNNAGEGVNSTGMYLNGASPTIPAITLGGGVNLHSGDILKAHVTYDGSTLKLTITDTSNTALTFSTSWSVNIPGTVGGNTAYVGFTGATGASTAIQEIATWTFSSTTPNPKTPVVYQTSTLPAVSSGPTFRTFTYSGFPDTTGTILDATKVGDNVTFTVNVANAGTYDVQLSYKKFSTRGISQLAINGTNFGATLDQYAATDSYAIVDYGTLSFPTAGTYSFKFAVTGKNAASSSYGISFDDITLTPQ